MSGRRAQVSLASEWLSSHSRSWRSATLKDMGLGVLVRVAKGKRGTSGRLMVLGIVGVVGGVDVGVVGWRES
jgi:hypothetical protein